MAILNSVALNSLYKLIADISFFPLKTMIKTKQETSNNNIKWAIRENTQQWQHHQPIVFLFYAYLRSFSNSNAFKLFYFASNSLPFFGYRVYLMVKGIMEERERERKKKWGGSSTSSEDRQRGHIFLLTVGFIFNLRNPFIGIFVWVIASHIFQQCLFHFLVLIKTAKYLLLKYWFTVSSISLNKNGDKVEASLPS